MRNSGFVLAFLLAADLSGGGGAQQPEITTRDVPVTFRTQVCLVSVPVVVRDRQGRAVGNLTRDDFQLFDSGKPQILSRFSVERFQSPSESRPASPAASESAPPIPDRFTAYLLDDLHATPEQLIWVRNAILRHLAESNDPLQRVALYTTSGRNSLDFTPGGDRLKQELLALSPRGSRADSSTECPPMTQFMADLIVNQRDRQALAVSIADYNACAGPSPGGADKVVESAARRTLSLADQDVSMTLDALSSVVAKMATMPGRRSILLASPGFLLLDGSRKRQVADLIDRAIVVNVMVHALDARGLDVRIPGGGAGQRTAVSGSTATLKADYERRGALQQNGVLADLASGTGGSLFENTNDAAQALARAAAPEFLYVLGFAPQALKPDGGYRPLKVVLRNAKGLTVEARRGYYAPTGEEQAAGEASRLIEQAFFSRDDSLDFPLEMQTRFARTAGDDATITVLARLGLSRIPFRKEAGRSCDDITLVVGLFDGNGNYVTGLRKILEMRLRDETLDRYRESGYPVRNDFAVKAGKYLVRLVARDSEGKLLTARSAALDIP